MTSIKDTWTKPKSGRIKVGSRDDWDRGMRVKMETTVLEQQLNLKKKI